MRPTIRRTNAADKDFHEQKKREAVRRSGAREIAPSQRTALNPIAFRILATH